MVEDRVSQIRYIIEREQSIYEHKDNVNEKCVRLNDEDILSIHWYAERFHFDSHQVSDLVSIIMSVLKRYNEEVLRKRI